MIHKKLINAVSSLVFLCGIAIIQPSLAEDGRRIAVNGSATVSVAPDRATLSLGVQARNADLDIAREEVVDTVERFLAFADDEGIERTDVQSSGLNIRPEYRWNENTNQQVLLGYVVQRDIQVALTDLEKLGRLIEGAVDLGINQVQPPVYDHSRRKELERDALAEATEDARSNAERIAETLGVKLGNVRTVAAQGERASPPMPMMAMAESASLRSRAETYTTGQISISAVVSAEFDVLTED